MPIKEVREIYAQFQSQMMSLKSTKENLVQIAEVISNWINISIFFSLLMANKKQLDGWE